MAKKKFDTNPLDPAFPDRIREAETAALPKNEYQTSEFPPSSVTEEQTRRFGNQEFNNYKSPFDGQNIPANFKTTQFANISDNNSRKTSKVGLPENILTALPYIPWFVGMIAGILILLFVPKSETKARFHAAQGIGGAHRNIISDNDFGFCRQLYSAGGCGKRHLSSRDDGDADYLCDQSVSGQTDSHRIG